jgi:hypothetical protein
MTSNVTPIRAAAHPIITPWKTDESGRRKKVLKSDFGHQDEPADDDRNRGEVLERPPGGAKWTLRARGDGTRAHAALDQERVQPSGAILDVHGRHA